MIRDVKRHVSVPVIGNGDVRSGADALRMLEETGCDGVLVGRAAQGNPWIFREIRAALAGEAIPVTTNRERIETALRHFELELRLHGERGGLLEMRKHIAWYVHGMRGAAKFRERVNRLEHPDEVRAALTDFAREADEA